MTIRGSLWTVEEINRRSLAGGGYPRVGIDRSARSSGWDASILLELDQTEILSTILHSSRNLLQPFSLVKAALWGRAAIVAWAHQSSAKAQFVAASRVASMSSMSLFAPIEKVDMKSAPGPVRASRTDRRSDRSCP